MTANHSNRATKKAEKKPKTPTAQKRDLQNKSFKSGVSFQLNQIYSLIDKGVKKDFISGTKPHASSHVIRNASKPLNRTFATLLSILEK